MGMAGDGAAEVGTRKHAGCDMEPGQGTAYL